MSNLTELTAQIIAARAAKKDMSTEEFQQEMQIVFNFLKGIESGDASATVQAPVAEEPKPHKINLKQYFKKDEVICLICNKSFTTLKRHLSISHDLKPGAYRKQFNIPSTQSLAAKSYVESRRQMAIDKNLGAGLAVGRAKKKANADAKIAAAVTKAPLPAVKVKTGLPAVKSKAALPAKTEVAKVPAKAKNAPPVKAPAKAKK